MNFFVLNSLPIPRPKRESQCWQRTVTLAGRLAALDDRFADWAAAVGVECGPLNKDEKDDSTNELDAVVAHLYGLSARQLRTVYETFHEGWEFEADLRDVLKHFESWKRRL